MTTPAEAPTASPTKTCPGFAPGGIAPHELPATSDNFVSNAGNRDGLATRCKSCGKAYSKAWSEAKAKGEKFSLRGHALVESPTAPQYEAPEPATVSVSPAPASSPQYANEQAVRAARGKAKGWGTETIGGLIYALPDGATASTPEGQAALELVNNAHATERRRRDAERKRAERAAAKARAGGAQA